ncbi:hypothetical protein ACFWVF_35870 [Streptomyces sp. NPDC058659]|uniref:hypothetical protein n=1 Tax=unclassified Streptomyces TaxID=2593676 RepID=UPI00364F14BC
MAMDEITHIRTERKFNGSQRRSTTPGSSSAFKIPHLDLIVKLCHQLSPDMKG